MSLILPKLPGYNIDHDPSKIDFKRKSSSIIQKIKPINLLTKSITIPSLLIDPFKIKIRTDNSKSLSQSVHINHYGPELTELFQPDWSKLEKKVLQT